MFITYYYQWVGQIEITSLMRKFVGWKVDIKKLLRMQPRKTEMKIPKIETCRIKKKKKKEQNS